MSSGRGLSSHLVSVSLAQLSLYKSFPSFSSWPCVPLFEAVVVEYQGTRLLCLRFSSCWWSVS